MTSITVRFVPRSESHVSFDDFFAMPPDQIAQMASPTKKEMTTSQRSLSQSGILSSGSALNRLTTSMGETSFREMFNVKPKRKKVKVDNAIILEDERIEVDKSLEIPDALKNSVAFAYVPRPVEFYSPNAIPPHEDIYHLRLSNVSLALNAPRCHLNSWNGDGVRVAMADSGFWLHPYFIRSGARLIPTESPGSGPADVDISGHGTGEAANIFAVAPHCTVYGVKHGSSAAGTLEACIARRPAVMTNSWGYSIDDKTRDELKAADPNMFFELVDLENIIRSATVDGICVLFSAGNGHLAFPASFPDVIAVGGVTLKEDGDLEASSYASGFTSKLYPSRNVPDVCGLVGRSEQAPMSAHIMLPVPPDSNLDGENFPSGQNKTGWGIFSGTSAACPQVAGLVALLKQIDNSLSPSQIKQVLAARAVDITKGKTATGAKASAGPDIATGAGLVDALRACGYVSGVV